MNRVLFPAAFAAGLLTVGWIGAGYLATHPLALTMTALIGAFYVMGAFELWRFCQATSALSSALSAMPEALPDPNPWLRTLPPALRDAVRQRIEGARADLPGPTLAPYLAGLLVLLGMVGTFLGMVVTLRGTGTALDSATDLPSIRASLSAPVKGLGLAFGTSVAGVTASAMLGLMSALTRRERLHAAQRLDARLVTTLRAFSPAHQREMSLALLQRQADAMPLLVDRLQTMMERLERHGEQLNERLIASQDRFHREAEVAYTGLAASVDRTLKSTLADSARIGMETIRPLADTVMSGIARETTALHQRVTDTVTQQFDAVSARFERTTSAVADGWQQALAAHERSSNAVAERLGGTLDEFGAGFERRSAALLDALAARAATAHAQAAEVMAAMARETAALHQQASDVATRRFQEVGTRFEQQASALAGTVEQQAATLARGVEQAHVDLQSALASRDAERLAAWTQALGEIAATLQREWQRASVTTEAQAQHMAAAVERLLQAAAEAPRAAADTIASLRQQLSDSLARDNEMLDERRHLMERLTSLLETVSDGAAEQRMAIDAMMTSSSAMLESAGERFAGTVEAQAEKLDTLGAQITSGAVEVASLGETFGFAVQRFGETSEQLAAQLQRIEAALDQSLARSDEQLAYYVAQAREIIDLSLMSQKQVVDELQRLAGNEKALAGEAA